MIRQKDPRIYDKNTKFYSSSSDEEDNNEKDNKEKKHKPKKIKDIVREQILKKIEKEENNGNEINHSGSSSSSEDEDDNDNDSNKKEEIKTYQQEQDELKNEFLKAANENDNNDDNDESDILLVKKKKGKKSKDNNDSDGENDEEDDDEDDEDDSEKEFEKYIEKSNIKDKELIKKYINENPENEYDKFLHDYIKKREWRLDNISDDETDHFTRIKSTKPNNYNNNNSTEKREKENKEGINVDEDEEEEFEDQNDRYELYYNNYRFNEEGGDQIISYARNIEGSLRRKKDKRKKERELKKEREYNERKRKEEELKRLKNLKKQEIANKIRELEIMAGKLPSTNVDGKEEECKTFTEKDIDGDFNPEEYDKRMNEIFNNDYYNTVDEETKPEIDDLLSDNEKELLLEDENDEGDYAPEPEIIDDDDDDKDKKKKKKKKNKDKKNKENNNNMEEEGGEGDEIYEEKPLPKMTEDELKAEKEKLLDELYGLDYEDTIGELHTRFKYHKVQPLDPGISTNELLLANDKELKQYMSIKKIAPYREKNTRINSKKRREFRQQLKERLEKEGYKLDEDGNLIEVPVSVMNEVSKNKKNKKRKHDNVKGGDSDNKKKHKKKKTMIPKGRLATYGL